MNNSTFKPFNLLISTPEQENLIRAAITAFFQAEHNQIMTMINHAKNAAANEVKEVLEEQPAK